MSDCYNQEAKEVNNTTPLIRKLTFKERLRVNYKTLLLSLIAVQYINDGMLAMRVLAMKSIYTKVYDFESAHL